MSMIRLMGLGSGDPGPDPRTHVEFSEDYCKTAELVADLGKVSVQLQSSRYYEAVAEGIALLLNVCGMAGLDYVSLPAWDDSRLLEFKKYLFKNYLSQLLLKEYEMQGQNNQKEIVVIMSGLKHLWDSGVVRD